MGCRVPTHGTNPGSVVEMTMLTCPNCRSAQGQSLDRLLSHDKVNYYICAECGHLWTVAKEGPIQVKEVAPRPTSVV